MKTDFQKLSFIILKPFILFSLSLFAFLSLQPNGFRLPPPSTAANAAIPSDLKIRPGYSSYDAYLQRQHKKTLNPKLCQIWTTCDWDRKVNKFAQFFSDLQRRDLISNNSRSLCIGARISQKVAALKIVGVEDSIGIDLVPYPPLVIKIDDEMEMCGEEMRKKKNNYGCEGRAEEDGGERRDAKAQRRRKQESSYGGEGGAEEDGGERCDARAQQRRNREAMELLLLEIVCFKIGSDLAA